jgi:short-subunit dehydrogenase
MKRMKQAMKTVLVTGAFGGIGKAVSAALSTRGHAIVRVGRRLPAGGAAPLPGPGRAIDIEADLASAAGWQQVMERTVFVGRRVDFLIHCAGTLLQEDIATIHENDARKMIDDNLMSTVLACRYLIPGMTAAHGGGIIILGSLGGIVPMPCAGVYSATKFAVRGFALSLAEELRGSGVSVSLVSCGPVDTRMLSSESRHRGSIGFVNRPLPPERVARVVLRLMEHPRRETVVPRFAGIISRVVGASTPLFACLYPLASAIGRSRKMKYRAGVPAWPDLYGRPI